LSARTNLVAIVVLFVVRDARPYRDLTAGKKMSPLHAGQFLIPLETNA
jgi:hypothetical protein